MVFALAKDYELRKALPEHHEEYEAEVKMMSDERALILTLTLLFWP